MVSTMYRLLWGLIPPSETSRLAHCYRRIARPISSRPTTGRGPLLLAAGYRPKREPSTFVSNDQRGVPSAKRSCCHRIHRAA